MRMVRAYLFILFILFYSLASCSKKSGETSTGPTEPTNNPPQILSWSASEDRVCFPPTVSYSWSIQDPDNDNMTCEIDVDNDGNPEKVISNCISTNNGFTWQFTNNTDKGKTYTSRLTVRDSKGASTYKDINIQVCARIPVADTTVQVGASDSISIPFYAYENDTLIFTASVVDGNDISYLRITDGVNEIYYGGPSPNISAIVRIPYTSTWKFVLGNTSNFFTKKYNITAGLVRW